MANTYSQISIHAVFAVRGRKNVIDKSWRDDLHRYISQIIAHQHGKPLAVGGWLDHVHVFFGLPVNRSLSDFMRTIKASSSKWVNEQGFIPEKFRWQSGYGAFSYSKSQRATVIRYIMNQEEHHRSSSFKEEYLKIMNDFDLEYDPKYLFDFYN